MHQELAIEIQFGEGGRDSKLFVDDLFGAYYRWAENNGWEVEILSRGDGKILSKFCGNNILDKFKYESGKHCVQRIPPTESKGRAHTSIISVAVLLLSKEKKLDIDLLDVDIKTQRGHGKGGQHQNVTDSCVVAVHKPTGLKVTINGRSQIANKREALRILESRIKEKESKDRQAIYNNKKKKQFDGGNRSGKVRTYNFINNRVVDHIRMTKTSKVKLIMKGHFELLEK